MGMKKIYTCDICRKTLSRPNDSFGVHFSDLSTFTLGGYECTDEVHICYECAKQLRDHLNKPEIEKNL